MDVLEGFFLLVVLISVVPLLLPRDSPQESPATSPTAHDQRASDRLVGLIDMLFALVLTLPILVGQDVIGTPWHSNVPVVLAFAIAYYVVVRSFVDWHLAMEDAPYWIRTSRTKKWELRRVYVDFLIVMVYAMLFLSARPLVTQPGGDIGLFLFILAVIPALYLLWGALRRWTYREQHEFRTRTLVEAVVGYGAVWAVYRLDRDETSWLAGHATARNVCALAIALAVLIAYRSANWNEMRHVRDLAVAATPDVATETAPAAGPPPSPP